jgi:hopanoid biosynthesis associated RND transporter like protein HpnN
MLPPNPNKRTLDQQIGDCLAQWVRWNVRHAIPVIVLFGLATFLFAGYTVGRLGISTDTTDMLSERLEWRQNFKDFRTAFPGRFQTILIVIDGERPAAVREAAARLRVALAGKTVNIQEVVQPGAGDFFDTHGLLYLDIDELQKISDRLTAAQPLLGNLSVDFNIGKFIEIVDEGLRSGDPAQRSELLPILDQLALATDAVSAAQSFYLDWQELLLDGNTGDHVDRAFLIVKPILDFSELRPAEGAMRDIRDASASLDPELRSRVRVRLTGEVAMEHEEFISISRGAGLAATVALVLVALVLFVALGSFATVAASLITLICGLVATTAFAAAAIGSLNLISVAFGILYIGLGIDFIIHLTLRAQELVNGGQAVSDALPGAARDVGSSLVICAITTAAGFYSFIPTAFDGVAELGLIAGTGMVISLFATLTLLPALLTRTLRSQPPRRPRFGRIRAHLLQPVARRRAPVFIAACILAVGSLPLINKVRFDSNPINLRDGNAESVQTFRELQEQAGSESAAAIILSSDTENTAALAESLRSLATVHSVTSVLDFVPSDQTEKLLLLEDLDFVLGPGFGEVQPQGAPMAGRINNALRSLRSAISEQRDGGPDEAEIGRLGDSIDRWFARTGDVGDATYAAMIARLQVSVLGDLPGELKRIKKLLLARQINFDALPPEVIERWVSGDGRQLIEVQAREDLSQEDAAIAFISQVREIEPVVTGLPVVYVEAKKSVVSAFRLAFILALTFVVIVLAVFLRSAIDTLLVLSPILLAASVTIAVAALLNLPFNFANIITLPLLLGIGVDNGIHMVHRMKIAPPCDGYVLLTSSSRAVLFSSLTTICSFGNLAFSPHVGMASMGTLLSIGLFASLLATLVFLPVLLDWRYRR